MKMHFLPRHAMCFCLRVCQNVEDTACHFFCAFRQSSCFNDLPDFRQPTMYMMMCMYIIMIMFPAAVAVMHMMFLCMLRMDMFFVVMPTVQICHIMIMIFVFFVQNHRKITGIQTGFFHPGNPDLISLQRQGSKRFPQFLFICAKI